VLTLMAMFMGKKVKISSLGELEQRDPILDGELKLDTLF
jgi:hypothetical protein